MGTEPFLVAEEILVVCRPVPFYAGELLRGDEPFLYVFIKAGGGREPSMVWGAGPGEHDFQGGVVVEGVEGNCHDVPLGGGAGR